jgi:NitT/TauT family transport system ATP-binding protein
MAEARAALAVSDLDRQRPMVTDSRRRRPSAVELSDVAVVFHVASQQPVRAIEGVDLQIRQGEFVAIVGPSGCGKTTILNLIAGLFRPTTGEVRRHGCVVIGSSRDVGYLLARAGLTPWRTARRNVELGMEVRGVPRSQRRARAVQLLDDLGIGQFADAYPAQLSHGMQQRVAIARTLAIEPDLWLMDEPFGALDAQTRLAVQSEFLNAWEGTGTTVLFVTHDLSEAVLMADRVLVMSVRPGRILSDHAVKLPRPRQLGDLRFDPTFVATQRAIWNELHDDRS